VSLEEEAARPSGVRRWAPRLVVVIAAFACLADQPPRWSMDAKVPATPPAAPGKALRVTIEASQEPSLQVKSGGSQRTWEDRATARTSWPGKADLFVDAGGTVDTAYISDRCTSGGGMCSNCDPPPGAYLRVLGISEVDVWSVSATTTIAAGTQPRIDLEIDATRDPLVVSVPSTDGSCSTTFASSSPFATPAGSGSVLPTPGFASASVSSSSPFAVPPASDSAALSAHAASASPLAPGSASPPAPLPLTAGARRIIVSCWERGAATITATIRGVCATGPCAAPAGESVAIGRVARVP
jgi:hypothetical protein